MCAVLGGDCANVTVVLLSIWWSYESLCGHQIVVSKAFVNA